MVNVKKAVKNKSLEVLEKINRKTKKKKYEGIEKVKTGNASYDLTDACLVLEGGAFRGLYTSGVLDFLMEHNINCKCVVGVSAGALNGINYAAGQIGRSALINLKYRHDGRWVGVQAFLKNGGPIGFDFVFGKIPDIPDLNEERLNTEGRRCVAVATNLETGEAEYFEYGKCDEIYKAMQASASMPYISKPVMVDGKPYLDGGCSVRIPYKWAMEEGYKKIIVVRTRPDDYRVKPNFEKNYKVTKRIYSKYEQFAINLAHNKDWYNVECNEVLDLKNSGRIFVFSPSKPITIGRLEGDMTKLGDLYFMGYNDAKAQFDDLLDYLKK